MKVVLEAERGRGRTRHASSRLAAFFMGVLLVLSQFCCTLSAVSGDNRNKISISTSSHFLPARKARHFRTKSSSFSKDHARRGTSRSNGDTFEDDKRLVHTGPNPLHN